MFEDDLANQIGELMAAHENQLDPRLERLASGTITEEERTSLEADAAKDPDLAAAVALHQPLSVDVHRRIAKAATRTGSRRRLMGVGIGTVLAAAAVLFVFVRADVEPIPDYTVAIEAGDAVWRGETAPISESLREDSTMSILLKPARVAHGRIDAALWVVDASGSHRSDVTPEISADGAVLWLGTAHSLSGGRTGPVTFVLFVGRDSSFPEVDQRGRVMQGIGWYSTDLSVEIIPLRQP